MAVKGIAQGGSSAKVNQVQSTKKVSNGSKGSTTKSKVSSSSGKQTKGTSGKGSKSGDTKKALKGSAQTAPKEKKETKGINVAKGVGKMLEDIGKSVLSKETKKKENDSQKVSYSSGGNTTV